MLTPICPHRDHSRILKCFLVSRDGSGPDPARPEAQPEGVLGDPDPSRTYLELGFLRGGGAIGYFQGGW